jgi:CBS domain-containing membrane protein
MKREVDTVSPNATAAEAARLMQTSRHGTLPVVDQTGKLLGVITRAALVRRCLPEYLEQVGDLYRSGEFRPFVDKVHEVGLLSVRDLMEEKPLVVQEDTPLAEVAAQMVTHGAGQVPVVREGRLAGIIGLQDIVDEIAWPEPEGEHER